MVDQELLVDVTESYLKSVISDASGSLSADFNSFAAFGELGINSFQVLKIIKTLEGDFGALPKSLLFEKFTIHDLANYFVAEHATTLHARFALPPAGTESEVRVGEPSAASARAVPVPPEPSGPFLLLEKDAYAHPELGELVRSLYERYKVEGSVSRGTRKIAPNLFIGSERRGYFNYARYKDIVMLYGYTGPDDYFPVLFGEAFRYCSARNLQLNSLSDRALPSIDGIAFSTTPFGVLQRILNLKEFSLDGGPMRRLRYQVTKFLKAGRCRTEEYRCGSNPEVDRQITVVMDRWCETRTVVNPLVYDVRAEILAGTLDSEHRVFLTWVDDVLQNVILITAMSAEENGYLMDLEFYLPEMPLGGLEYAISQIIEVLIAEKCDVLSLGGTYGCKLEPCAGADPQIDQILDELREKNIFNDAGNLQFKNKFRPETKPIYLCRAVGSGNPENVIDIIMMIADPDRMQTPVVESAVVESAVVESAVVPSTVVNVAVQEPAPAAQPAPLVRPRVEIVGGSDRMGTLSQFGFNPLNIPAEHVEFDLKTDSWSQLEMPAIQAQMRHLHGQLQQSINVDDSVRTVFPFAHLVLTKSGQAAEHVFFKAWPKQGLVLQNLLFPSTIFHQIDNGFTPREVPHAEVFRLNSQEPYKGNLAWDALWEQVAKDPGAIALVCVEVTDNAAGGYPVSLQHLREVKALLAEQNIPLVIDATRVLENAQFLIEHDAEMAGRSMWAVVREILSCADAVIGSLTKDFGVNRGGIVATNDPALYQRLQEIIHEEGTGLDVIDRKLIAISLRNRKFIEGSVLRRMEGVRRIWRALHERNVPVVQPPGAHCVVVDVKQLPEFTGFAEPVASFLAWLYLNTGIRGGAHSVGMQQHTSLNELVRLAIPVGLKNDQIDTVIERLVRAFDEKANIPEIVREGGRQPFGGVHANYTLVKMHKAPASPAAIVAPVAAAEPPKDVRPAPPSARPAPAAAAPAPSAPAQGPNALQPAGSERGGESTKPRRTQDIAIVGMAGRYPKAKNLEELWDNLVQGRDCVEQMPADRYERRVQHGSFERFRGGFIDDIDKFDSLFFNISPREAEMLDPQERLFLESAWEALEDAGYYPEILAQEDGPRNIGVFVGAVWAMYQILGVEEKHLGNKIAPNSFLWSVANRVSYALNLTGPSLTVDTACSSSLTALYLACEAIRNGECTGAVVGGVNLDLHQARFDINHQGGALSADGVCRTFGKGANGYVMGEGVGALFLKPLDQAERDGDHIYGVIKSAVVNHGGRTSGYTVPNPKAQASLIAAALEKANVGANTIGYIEAHGTGTALGDPVEITGLSGAFSADEVENQSCPIGSVKTNIGHLEAAAGIVSISKVLLQMKHRQIAPSLHSAELNELIDFEKSPFYVVQKLEEWKAREVDGVRLPLRAGISSFGAGGSNAHVILESYEPSRQEREATASARPLIFPLSARSEDSLREIVSRLARFVSRNDVNLSDAAYTLQQGRKSFEQRVAIVAATKADLIERLTAFVEGKKNADVVTGQAKGSDGVMRFLNRRQKQEFIRMVSEDGDVHQIAGMWVEGLLSDWGSGGGGRRISLPTYAFADKRHWVSAPAPVRRALQPAAGLHPIIDSNESTFERQLFRKTFHERDFFIYDHHVSDIATLPGVAYLELARKAGEIAANRKVRKIRNILWISPIVVQNGASKDVYIELKPNRDTVQFEVFSEGPAGSKVPHSQGTLLYETPQEAAAEPETIDLAGVRSRCAKVIDGKTAYPLFKSFGLNLGPSFQVLDDVYKSDAETLGVLRLPDFRQSDLQSMVLHPSLVDGSLQAGMAGQLGGQSGEMFVPFSIGEVEILQPLQSNCFSYVTPTAEDAARKGKSATVKSNVLIVDETGKVLVKIRDSVGVPLRDVHKKAGDDFAKLFYSYDWEQAPLAAESATRPQSLVLFDTDETLRELADDVILVRPGATFAEIGQTYTVNPRNKEDFARLFESLIAKGTPVENICFAWPRHEQPLNEALEHGVYAFLYLSQALLKHKLEASAQLLYLYAGNQPHHEAVSGFVNALRLEHPKLLCKTVELNGRDSVEAIATELQARTQDTTAVRYDAGERFTRKLKAFDLEPGAGTRIRENGVVLITGGAGGLGLIFAEFLSREYKSKVVLTGRSALTDERAAKLDALKHAGAEVVYIPADVTSAKDVKKLVRAIKGRFGQLNGVIHAAGVLRDSLIRNKTAEEMSAVLAPKVFGTLHLDDLTTNEDLDFFVTFSSLSAVKGNAGQSDYSFANHYMDSFAADRERRRAAGSRKGQTLSVNWSIWAEGGMKLDEQTEQYFKSTLGISPLGAAAGCDAFVRGLASGRTQFAALEGLQEKVELAWGLKKKPAPAATQAAPAAQAAAGDADLVTPLLDDLTQIVMGHLKLDAADVAHDKILLDLGYDSIGLTSFANAINEKYQLDVTPVLFFDHPSLGEIANHLCDERRDEISAFYRGGAAAPAATPAPAAAPQAVETTFAINKGWSPAAIDGATPQPAPTQALPPQYRFLSEPIAIVGMSGVMPLSEDLDEYWDNLRSSRDLISVVPRDRWRWEDYDGDPAKEPNKSSSKWGGFLREVDKFDAEFFGISPREAEMMDPQQRLFLQTVWKAVEDSGQKVSDLSGTKTGVFVGVSTSDYLTTMSSRSASMDLHVGPGNAHSVLANRVSFQLNLNGPSAPIDTACSSSLIALHRAVESIRSGGCEAAIVGGVHTMISPGGHITFSMAGLMSGDGKCRSFDRNGTGYSRGEGCGALFLKPLSVAEADGNPIYAVIKSTAENHGGRVAMLTAPNASAQSALLVEAYEKARIDPATVGYIECHGTGTSLGDPIEVQGMSRAFAELYKKQGKPVAERPHVGLSCVKSNMGHLETAAGVASVLKVALAMKHKQIPATLHFQELNPYIKLKNTPFYVVDKLTEWEAPTGENGAPLPRRAGVSAFGFGGANAHVVLEEYVAPQRAARTAAPALIVLSAKNAARLDAYVESLLAFVDRNDVELADLAYTLQVGRDEMTARLAVVASSVEDLKQKLATRTDAYRNDKAVANTAAVQEHVERKDLARLAELWTAGAKIDWRLLHTAGTAKRVSAPTYPFAKDRHWFPIAEEQAAPQPVAAQPVAAQPAAPHVVPSLVTGAQLAVKDNQVLPDDAAATPLDLDELRRRMRHGQRDQDSVYAEFEEMGLHYDPAHRTITAVHHGDQQLLARLALPPIFAATEANGSHTGFVLHPSVIAGAMQAGIRLIAAKSRGEAPVLPRTLERLRVLSPCTEEMFAWARHAQDAGPEGVELDIDLIDAEGRVCVQIRGLSFHAVTEAEPGAEWLFGADGAAAGADEAAATIVPMPGAEKMELFLRQELALQLQKPLDCVPADRNYFDLGLTSLVIAHLVQKTSRVLGEDLHPSALLEYSDVRGVASYLAATYPESVDALTVARRSGNATPADISSDISPEDAYETMTF